MGCVNKKKVVEPKSVHEAKKQTFLYIFFLLKYLFMYILCKIYLNRYKGVKCGISTQYVLTHASISTVTTLSVPRMCRKNVMRTTYVLERQRNTDCCPVLSVGAHGALL